MTRRGPLLIFWGQKVKLKPWPKEDLYWFFGSKGQSSKEVEDKLENFEFVAVGVFVPFRTGFFFFLNWCFVQSVINYYITLNVKTFSHDPWTVLELQGQPGFLYDPRAWHDLNQGQTDGQGHIAHVIKMLLWGYFPISSVTERERSQD